MIAKHGSQLNSTAFESASMAGRDPLIRKHMFYQLLRMRLVEEKIAELYKEQEMRCPTHFSIGQEAVAAGVCAHLESQDYVMSAHRSHAHYLGKGGNLKRMIAELYGKETGCARGKGGSMHLIDTSVGFLGCVPIVGSTIPIGVGIAFGSGMRRQNGITAIFFGDGATETGVFHESVNYAAIHQLPVLFVCENNLYSVNTPLEERQPRGREIIHLAQGHGLPVAQADGQDCDDVFAATASLISDVRKQKGPAFLEFFTYRWLEHCGPNPDLNLNFRPEGEYEHWIKRDPIPLYSNKLLSEGVLTQQEINNFNAQISLEIEEAFLFAKNSPFPKRSELLMGVFPSQYEEEKACLIEN